MQTVSNLICITNRKLCKDPFPDRIKLVASSKPKAIILREKDLDEVEYEKLARTVRDICSEYNVLFIIHNHPEFALKLLAEDESTSDQYKDIIKGNIFNSSKAIGLHMPLKNLRDMSEADRHKFSILGASCHSIEDALEAQSLGCSYIIAGHIFDTDCKKGLPGRGLFFLKEVCEGVKIPVYAIGGITPSKMPEVMAAKAKGGCMMSGFMCEDQIRS